MNPIAVRRPAWASIIIARADTPARIRPMMSRIPSMSRLPSSLASIAAACPCVLLSSIALSMRATRAHDQRFELLQFARYFFVTRGQSLEVGEKRGIDCVGVDVGLEIHGPAGQQVTTFTGFGVDKGRELKPFEGALNDAKSIELGRGPAQRGQIRQHRGAGDHRKRDRRSEQ